MEITVKLVNAAEVRKRLNLPFLLAEPLQRFLSRGAAIAQGEIQQRTPRDTARLQRGFSYVVDTEQVPEWAHVINPVNYLAYVEEGTKPHPVSTSEVAGWARRHGIPPFLVARAIARRGTKGAGMIKKSIPFIITRLGPMVSQLARDIEGKWGGK